MLDREKQARVTKLKAETELLREQLKSAQQKTNNRFLLWVRHAVQATVAGFIFAGAFFFLYEPVVDSVTSVSQRKVDLAELNTKFLEIEKKTLDHKIRDTERRLNQREQDIKEQEDRLLAELNSQANQLTELTKQKDDAVAYAVELENKVATLAKDYERLADTSQTEREKFNQLAQETLDEAAQLRVQIAALESSAKQAKDQKTKLQEEVAQRTAARDFPEISATAKVGNPEQVAFRSDNSGGLGTICCAVMRSSFPGKIFALSALSPALTALRGRRFAPLDVVLRSPDGDRLLGKTLSVRGSISAPPEFSMDAQLISVQDAQYLTRALGGMILEGFVQRRAEIPSTYWIRTSHGPVRARFSGLVHRFSIPYRYVNQPLIHRTLIESRIESTTVQGNAGAPITTKRDGGILVGMHIAADSKGTEYAIPAWNLFDPSGYNGMSDGESISIYNDDTKSDNFTVAQ